MRPERWDPPVALSAAEQAVARRIKRAKLFTFLRRTRHERVEIAGHCALGGERADEDIPNGAVESLGVADLDHLVAVSVEAGVGVDVAQPLGQLAALVRRAGFEVGAQHACEAQLGVGLGRRSAIRRVTIRGIIGDSTHEQISVQRRREQFRRPAAAQHGA